MIDFTTLTLTPDQEARIAAILLEPAPPPEKPAQMLPSHVMAHRRPLLTESLREALRGVHAQRLATLRAEIRRKLPETSFPEGPAGGRILAALFHPYFATDCRFDPEPYRQLCPRTFGRMQRGGK